MRVKIFNRGKGWYISATNYKNPEDKAYMNLFFAKCDEPMAMPTDKGYSVTDIDILEAKFSAYQGKMGMTIFKYSFVENNVPQAQKTAQNSFYNSPKQDVNVKPDDLPFF